MFSLSKCIINLLTRNISKPKKNWCVKQSECLYTMRRKELRIKKNRNERHQPAWRRVGRQMKNIDDGYQLNDRIIIKKKQTQLLHRRTDMVNYRILQGHKSCVAIALKNGWLSWHRPLLWLSIESTGTGDWEKAYVCIWSVCFYLNLASFITQPTNTHANIGYRHSHLCRQRSLDVTVVDYALKFVSTNFRCMLALIIYDLAFIIIRYCLIKIYFIIHYIMWRCFGSFILEPLKCVYNRRRVLWSSCFSTPQHFLLLALARFLLRQGFNVLFELDQFRSNVLPLKNEYRCFGSTKTECFFSLRLHELNLLPQANSGDE